MAGLASVRPSLADSQRTVPLTRQVSGILHGALLGGALYTALALCAILSLPLLWSNRLVSAWVVQPIVKVGIPLCLLVGRIRVRGTGADHLADLPKGFIIIANHASNLDPMVLMKYLRRYKFAFLAKQETLERPVTGRLLAACGWMGVDRSSVVGLKRFQEQVKARKRTGWTPDLVVFPEGTRSVDGKLLPFQAGPFLLAAQLGLPLVPVVIRGAHPCHKRNAFKVFPGTIAVDIKQPIFPPPGKLRADRIIDTMNDLKQRAEAVFQQYGDLNSIEEELDLVKAEAA